MHLVINSSSAHHNLVTQVHQPKDGESAQPLGLTPPGVFLATAEGRLTAASCSLAAEPPWACHTNSQRPFVICQAVALVGEALGQVSLFEGFFLGKQSNPSSAMGDFAALSGANHLRAVQLALMLNVLSHHLQLSSWH